MQNDGPKTMGMPQGYTVDDLNNDAAAQVSIQQRPSPLDAITADIARTNQEIARLENEMGTIAMRPELIPVPEDERINPLRAIGAGLRAIGGDASSLDSLLAKKDYVANQQRAVEAQNIMAQNSWNMRRLGEIRDELTSRRDRISQWELAAAEIVDAEAKDDSQRGMTAFMTQVEGLRTGVGSADDIIANYPQEFKESKYTPSFLRALEIEGRKQPVVADQGTKGMFANDWLQSIAPSVDAQLQEIAAGGIAEAELSQRINDVMVDISMLETESEGGRLRRQQYIDRLAQALQEGGMADAEARKAAEEAAAAPPPVPTGNEIPDTLAGVAMTPFMAAFEEMDKFFEAESKPIAGYSAYNMRMRAGTGGR